jgi:hypothetical protein
MCHWWSSNTWCKITSLALKGSGSWPASSDAKTGLIMLEKTMKKSIKKDDFTAKKGFFIMIRTKAFIWTAKVSIILSEKNDLREFWKSSRQL